MSGTRTLDRVAPEDVGQHRELLAVGPDGSLLVVVAHRHALDVDADGLRWRRWIDGSHHNRGQWSGWISFKTWPLYALREVEE